MNEVTKTTEAFSPILTRIASIERGDQSLSNVGVESVISSVISNDIHSNPDDALQEISYLRDKIEGLFSDLSEIYMKKFPEVERNPFDPDPIQTYQEIIEGYVKETKQELSAYQQFLVELERQSEDHLAELGSNRFANAGYKISLNLTAKDMAILVDVMMKTGFIKKAGLTNTDIYNFFIKNFSTELNKPVPLKTLRNAKSKYTGKKTDDLERKIQELLTAIENY